MNDQERAEALDLARAIAPERPTRPWAWSASDWLQVAHRVAAALLATNEELDSAQAEVARLREELAAAKQERAEFALTIQRLSAADGPWLDSAQAVSPDVPAHEEKEK